MKKLFLFIIVLIFTNFFVINIKAEGEKVPLKPDQEINYFISDNFYGPKVFFCKEYPTIDNIDTYLNEIIYLGVLNKNIVRNFADPKTLNEYVDTNFPHYKNIFSKQYDFFKTNDNKNTKAITRVDYTHNEKVYYSVEFIITDDEISKPQIEGPSTITYHPENKPLNKLFDNYNYYSIYKNEELYKERLYKVFDNTLYYINNLAKITTEGDYIIKKYFQGYGEVSKKITIEKLPDKRINIMKVNNNVNLELKNDRPTENQLLQLYKEELLKQEIHPQELTINYSSYSQFDKSSNTNFMIINYKINNQIYEDKFFIFKNSLVKENKLLKYNLYISGIIGGLILLYVSYPFIKRAIIKTHIKVKTKKIDKKR